MIHQAEKLALMNSIDALELLDTKSQLTVEFSKMCIDYNDIEQFDSCVIQKVCDLIAMQHACVIICCQKAIIQDG